MIFYRIWKKEAKTAKNRVWVQAMFFEPGSIMTRLTQSLSAASNRNLDVRVHADWFSLKFSEGPALRKGSVGYQRNLQMFQDLRELGIAVTILNLPSIFTRIFPYAGRNHMKITIIDTVAYLGGVNFGDHEFEFYDFMVKLTDPKIVTSLSEIFISTERHIPLEQTIRIDAENELVVDTGRIWRSTILKSAISCVHQAKASVLHTSQFVPDGSFLRALIHQRKLIHEVEIIAPSKNDFNKLFLSIYYIGRLFFIIRSKGIQILYSPIIVHAKLTILDGEKVIIGSHNLNAQGVRVGTTEIALISENKTLVRNLMQYYDDLKQSIIHKTGSN